MKIKLSQLRRIIKEEIERSIIAETHEPYPGTTGYVHMMGDTTHKESSKEVSAKEAAGRAANVEDVRSDFETLGLGLDSSVRSAYREILSSRDRELAREVDRLYLASRARR